MTSTQSVLRRGLQRAGEQWLLVLDPAFQGLPDTAHGGSVLAAFDLVSGADGPRTLLGHYRRRVPLDIPLALTRTSREHVEAFTLSDPEGILLVDGRTETVRPASGVSPQAPAAIGAPPPARAARAQPLPVSRACLACGVENPLGLQARLGADDDVVAGTWLPRPALRAGDVVASLALTTLLDETAFWLGALASGESGMTTELSVTLHAAAPADAPITVWGERAATRPRADDPRYWETRAYAADSGGHLLASAAITFVAVRGAARRLAAALVALNPADIVYRVFPTYAR